MPYEPVHVSIIASASSPFSNVREFDVAIMVEKMTFLLRIGDATIVTEHATILDSLPIALAW